MTHHLNPTTGAFTGSAVLTAANGDGFTTEFQGEITSVADAAGWVTFDVFHTIAGGTGRFAGATGSFVGVDGRYNLVTGEDIGGYVGTIRLPAPTGSEARSPPAKRWSVDAGGRDSASFVRGEEREMTGREKLWFLIGLIMTVGMAAPTRAADQVPLKGWFCAVPTGPTSYVNFGRATHLGAFQGTASNVVAQPDGNSHRGLHVCRARWEFDLG